LDVRKNGGFIWITKLDDFCVEKVKIEALKGKIFNFNENNENPKVYPSACGRYSSELPL
jgi:hypothetical protein